MANPRKFSEKIALLNQKQAEETARFEQIMKEVSDVTSRAASASSSVAASPMSAGKPSEILSGGAGSKTSSSGAATPGGPPAPRPLSVKSAGASPPQSSDNHLHISLGNQYRAGGSLPNVNAGGQGQPAGPQEIATSAAIHSIDLKTALNTLEEMQQQNQMAYRQGPGSSPGPPERGRNHDRVGGPMRSRPMEKRHDTSPYSGQPYLSPPNIETWRRTNSDSALHQSANEACQGGNTGHRRDQQRHSTPGTDPSQHYTGQFIERPRSSCEIPRVPGINIFPSSQPPGPQIPICKNTGSLPDLSNVHFSSPMPTPLDQEDHSSGSQYSNSPQPSSPTTLSPTSLAQAVGLSLTQDHSPPSAQNRLSVPVNHRFLPSCKQGLTADNNTSSSQQDVRITYPQQTSPVQQHHPGLPHSQPQNIPGSASPGGFQQPGHSPGHYVHYQPHSPSNPISPNSQVQMHQQNTQGQFNSLSYRTSQMVNRPSPQSSPSLTFQGSPLSYSNNPSAPSSPTSHIGPPNLSLDPSNDNVYINQVHAEFESFTMDWVQMMQQLEDTGYSLSTPLDEMDSPSTNMTHYMNSPSHNTGQCNQSDILNVGEMPSGDGGYYSTSPLGQLSYQARSTNTTQQMTPQTPNTPTIVLTDCSLVPDDLVGTDFGKDFSAAIAPFGQDVFPLDDPLVPDLNALHQEDINALRNDLDPVDLEDLQRLSNADMVLSDPVTEDNFRLEQH